MTSVTKLVNASARDGYEDSMTMVTDSDSNPTLSSSNPNFLYIFDGLTELQGKVIDSAYLHLYGSSGSNADIDALIKLENVAASADIVSTPADISNRSLVSGSVAWSATWSSGYIQSPNIKTILQTLVVTKLRYQKLEYC